MKKTSRILKNGSPAAAVPQSKTQHGKAPARPAGTITCVWTFPDGSEWARVDFPLEYFSLIKRAAAKLGITLAQFFDNAICSYVDSHDAKVGALKRTRG